MPLRLALTTAVVLAGTTTAVASVAVHREAWGWPLAVLAPVAAAVALPAGGWVRLPWCLAWGGTVFAASFARPEGDYLIGADAEGYGLLAAALVTGVAGIAGLLPRRARADTGPGDPPP
jgi:hypothetical protein